MFEHFHVDVETFKQGDQIVSRSFTVREKKKNHILSGVQVYQDVGEWGQVQWSKGGVKIIDGGMSPNVLATLERAVLQMLEASDQVRRTCSTLEDKVQSALRETFVQTPGGKKIGDLYAGTRPQTRGGGGH